MNKVKVTFETITPLWTGNAWQENVKIRPSSIINSLRFWFEIFCYFNDIEVKSYEEEKELNYEKFTKSVRKYIENGKNSEGAEDQALGDLGISLPSRIFGCKGWQGRVKIKEITPVNGYCFGNKLNLPEVICLEKQNKEWKWKEFETRKKWKDFKTKRNLMKKNKKNNLSSWFLNNPYFYGEFQVTFETDDVIRDSVLFPLLKFVEKYGFLGGKWNTGYGRVKIKDPDLNQTYDEFKLSNFCKKNNERFENEGISLVVNDDSKKNFNNSKNCEENCEVLSFFLNIDNFNCGNEKDFDEKTSTIPKDIRRAKFDDLDSENFKEILQKLLKKKAQIRNCLRPYDNVDDKNKWNNFRHKLLGTTKKLTEGTKVLPLIYKENGKWKGILMSIAGIMNFKEESNGEQ